MLATKPLAARTALLFNKADQFELDFMSAHEPHGLLHSHSFIF